MEAKEMFEEVGFERTRNDKNYIIYSLKGYNDGFYYRILFDLIVKKIKVRRYRGVIDRFFFKENIIGFDYKDIPAIYQQCKELGWLEDVKD